ncbi:GTPase IMAP family member 9 [Labeo rohita]|uniref:GTPase IMAP family member 9 n=1 Tax=Labeo rohita TaxID=84645 RepID=A0ABQ8L5C9_LABRO|nr:GTPase IMAP family member 9 [Labeo rohita]KAI2645938.1 GTPase IMAP family member 9 [Labeo rohita]
MASANQDVRIVLLGKTGAGKSSTGNTILGQVRFHTKLSSKSVINTCERQEIVKGGRRISVIDTPGLLDTNKSERDIKVEIARCVSMSAPGPRVFLLVIRLAVRFTDEERDAVKWIQKNFGEEATRYTIVLFTHADELKDQSLDKYIRENIHIQRLVNNCGGRFHSFNNRDIWNSNQVTELMKKIEQMMRNNSYEMYKPGRALALSILLLNGGGGGDRDGDADGDKGGQHYNTQMYKQAQQKIEKEAFQQKETDFTKVVLVLGGLTLLVAGPALISAAGPAVVFKTLGAMALL